MPENEIIRHALEGMAEAMRALGHDVQASAERSAPIGTPPDDPHPGELKANIKVEKDIRGTHIIADTDYAGVVEATQTPFLQSALLENVPHMAPTVAAHVRAHLQGKL